MDPHTVIRSPWLTEKSLDARDLHNRLEFIVNRKATKADIARAIEILLVVKVAKVNVRITGNGKHASVRLADGYSADDAALRLGAF